MKEWQINNKHKNMKMNPKKEINCQSNPGGQTDLIPWHALPLRIKVYEIKHLISETYPPLLSPL